MSSEIQSPVGLLYGGFRIVGEIGRGAMGIVYLAEQEGLNRKVALKVLPKEGIKRPETLERFKREASAVARLHHPNIVPIYGVGEQDGNHYHAMEYLQGATLKQVIYTEHLTHDEAARVACDILRALQYAHSQGIIHRDIKPANIMMVGKTHPMITDFGLARQDDLTKMTMAGVLVGTPTHMSPEQAGGPGQDSIDHRVDIYAVGVTLFELLTGRLPFYAQNLQDLLSRVRLEAAPSLRKYNATVPKDLESICLKALEKDRDCRYQTAEEMALDLERFLGGEPVLAKPASVIEIVARKAKRNLYFAVGGAGILLALGVLLIWLLVSIVSARREASALRTGILEARGREDYKQALELLGRLKAVSPEDPFTYQHEASLQVALGRQEEDRRLKALLERAQGDLGKAHELRDRASQIAQQVAALHDVDLARAVLADDFVAIAEVRERVDILVSREAELLALGVESYQAVLRAFPGNKEASRGLGYLHDAMAANASQRGDTGAARVYRGLARHHAPDLTERERVPGIVTIETKPPSEAFVLNRFDAVTDREGPVVEGRTPAEVADLPPQSYVLRFAERNISFPFVLAPGERHALALDLRAATGGPEGFAYVPPGPVHLGGDPRALDSGPSVRVNLDYGYFMAKRELRVEEYLTYLNAVPRSEAIRNAPQTTLYRIELRQGIFQLVLFNELDPHGPDTPIVGLTPTAIRDYCAWRSRHGDFTFRMPTSLEWQKAARGADSRPYPWGYRPPWSAEGALIARKEAQNAPFPKLGGSHPEDVSVYGVLDMGGNVSEWTSTPYEGSRTLLVCHGIAGFPFPEFHRVSSRYPVDAGSAPPKEIYLGVRLAAVRK